MFSRKNVRRIGRPLTLLFAAFGMITILFVGSSNAAETKVIQIPQTAEEHLAMAQRYKEKADQYREEANIHRKMKEDYRRKVALNPKSPVENPWISKMSIHCEQYIKEAQNLADESIKFSEYHTMRAKELQGE